MIQTEKMLHGHNTIERLAAVVHARDANGTIIDGGADSIIQLL